MEQYTLTTGATSGLGLAYTKWFTGERYHLIITGRRKEVIEGRADEIRNTCGCKVIVILADLTEETGVSELLNQLKGEAIDVLVNNAGFDLCTESADTDAANIKRLIYLQTTAVARITHHVPGGMKREGEGRVVNVSSDGAFVVVPKNVVYAAIKRFIVTLTGGLHTELTGYGIHVQAVRPGFTDSGFHESASMKMDKSRKGMFAFCRPEDMVGEAMESFAKGKVVYVPDRAGKFTRALTDLLPKKTYYRVASGFAARSLQKGGESLRQEQWQAMRGTWHGVRTYYLVIGKHVWWNKQS